MIFFLLFLSILLIYSNSFIKRSNNIFIKNNFKLSKVNNDYEINKFNWYVVAESDNIPINKPKKITIRDTPITLWRSKINKINAILDICPHRGASISNGRIDKDMDCAVCPYHTFLFNKHGRLIKTTGKENLRNNQKFNNKTDVPYFDVKELNGWIYLNSVPNFNIENKVNQLWQEPEAFDNRFRCVKLSKIFNMDARTVTENSIDILHISEIHSFGNKENPLPKYLRMKKISEGHYKVIYKYEASINSIPRKIFGLKDLIIENEYILPHYTVARVKFGSFTNTIVTSALPISKNKTKLFVKAYRDNWVFNIPILDKIFDLITIKLMDETLNEDKNVVENIYPKYKDGNYITKYDKIINNYRIDYKNYINNT